MKLPLLTQLRVTEFPQTYSPRHSSMFNVSHETEPATDFLELQDYRTTVEIGYTQRLPPNPDLEAVKLRAQKAIMRNVYGPIIDRLYEVLELLRQEGASAQDASYQEICQLIDILSGDVP